MSEGEKQRLKEYKKKYCEASKSQSVNQQRMLCSLVTQYLC